MTTSGRAATFRERLRRGDRLLGTWVETPHPALIEILGAAPLDCLCVTRSMLHSIEATSTSQCWPRARRICPYWCASRVGTHPKS